MASIKRVTFFKNAMTVVGGVGVIADDEFEHRTSANGTGARDSGQRVCRWCAMISGNLIMVCPINFSSNGGSTVYNWTIQRSPVSVERLF